MSDENNTNIMERAYDMLEEFTNHPAHYDTLLLEAIRKNDLEEIQHLTVMMEGYLSMQHFQNYDLEPESEPREDDTEDRNDDSARSEVALDDEEPQEEFDALDFGIDVGVSDNDHF